MTESSRKDSSSRIVVVFVAASQVPGVRERAAKEFKKITEKIQESKYRDDFHFERIEAVRFGDIRTALLRHRPNVLHISTQGEEDGSLTFQSDEDGRHVVPKKNVLKLLKALRDNLRLVFFNSVYTRALACDVPPIIDLAIGMNTTVPDAATIEFAVAFYESLAYGRTVANAVEVALAGLDDSHELELFPAESDDLDNKRELRFAAPPSEL